jgi:NAD(P)-dependent dehydrogenase (short-subunit alcohol dehydrogenase family)
MLLEGKNAVVYGAGGIGRAMATAFAAEGATVYLASRTRAKADRIAADIRAAGGGAEAAELDALDEAAVDRHADDVAARAGSLDISVNVISWDDVQGTALAEMPLADFEAPIHKAMRTNFLTWRAAARHMIPQQAGVILAFGGGGDPIRDYNIGGFQIALQTVEALRRQFAAENGRHGIRVVTLLTGGIPETIPDDFEGRDELVEFLTRPTLLGRTATLEDVGAVAAFAASDKARMITAAAINITGGAAVD